ncbi:hypothetical protein BVRB_7g167630 [Beta vulgaris subsp. vulgaris]|nr:hypothetical protein BVRB_7g167630 [Beta vulgaris subsp. vulgaris]
MEQQCCHVFQHLHLVTTEQQTFSALFEMDRFCKDCCIGSIDRYSSLCLVPDDSCSNFVSTTCIIFNASASQLQSTSALAPIVTVYS